MKGTELNEENALQGGLNFANALMADARLICDPFIQAKIRQMITKRIEAAKIGVIRVHGNFPSSAEIPTRCAKAYSAFR